MSRKFVIIFICIVLFGSVLRLFRITDIPSGFHADEAAFGYNTYSLLKTGRDEYGKVFPLILKSFGDYKAGIYSYLTIPFVFVFGLSEFAIRLTSAIFGILLIILTYLITLEISRDRKLAIISSFVAAVSPVGILLSRVQSDPLVCFVIFFIAYYCWVLWTVKRKGIFLFIALGALILSFLTYVETRLFALPFFVALGFVYWKTYKPIIRKVYGISIGLIFIVVLLLTVSSASTRLSQINVFSKEDVQILLEEEIREDGGGSYPILMTRIFHNKVIGYTRYIVKNYSDYLNANFLFFQAEQPLRERIPNVGILYLFECPFLLIGIYMAIRRRLSYGIFSILWILIVPAVLSVISGETPNIHRFFLASLPLYVLISLGILTVIHTVYGFKRYMFIVAITVVYVFSLSGFLHELFVHQPVHIPFFRGYAYKALVGSIVNRYQDYSQIIVTKSNQSPYIYFLFYSAYDPGTYQSSGSHRDLDYLGFDKYLFVPRDCPSFNEKGDDNIIFPYSRNALLVRRGDCKQGINDHIFEYVYWKDGTIAFQLADYRATESAKLK